VGVNGHIRIYILLVHGLDILSTAEAQSKASGNAYPVPKEAWESRDQICNARHLWKITEMCHGVITV
jgi:hypothetical protein